MKRKAVGGGVYQGDDGKFYTRPWVNGKRTWRVLEATREREAIREANRADFKAKELVFEELAEVYLAKGCPNAKLESHGRSEDFIMTEERNIAWLAKHFAKLPCSEFRLHKLPDYHAWRVQQIKRDGFSGDRTVDLELTTASNVLTYGVASNQIEANHIRTGRPKFARESEVKHAPERAPRDGDEINQIADHLFSDPRSETSGWLTLFSCVFGLRKSELYRLRKDAKIGSDNHPEPGLIKDGWFYLRRSKRGINPRIKLSDLQAEILACHAYWHSQRYGVSSPWFFPGQKPQNCITEDAFNDALSRACENLSLGHHIAPHGCRSYFVTCCRRAGDSDAVIAEKIGDRDVTMVSKVYGDLIQGPPLGYFPSEGFPAWRRWEAPERKIVSF